MFVFVPISVLALQSDRSNWTEPSADSHTTIPQRSFDLVDFDAVHRIDYEKIPLQARKIAGYLWILQEDRSQGCVRVVKVLGTVVESGDIQLWFFLGRPLPSKFLVYLSVAFTGQNAASARMAFRRSSIESAVRACSRNRWRSVSVSVIVVGVCLSSLFIC